MMRLLLRTIAVLVVMLLSGALMLAVAAVVPAPSPGINQSDEAQESMPAETEPEDEGEEAEKPEGSGEHEEESMLAGLTGTARDIGIVVLVTLAVSWLGRQSHSVAAA